MELKVDVTTDRKKKVFLNIIFYFLLFKFLETLFLCDDLLDF
jgi:hypothetical protein